jgi:hypothetical protein
VRLKSRQPEQKWKPIEVVADIATAFFGDSERAGVRAAAILRYALERMPKSTLKTWEEDAATDYPGRGMPSHGVFKFDFDEDDRIALYMDHDRSVLIREVDVAFDLDEARRAAVAWVGDPFTECGPENVPGVYLAALIEAVTGVPRFWNEFEMGWWFPGEGPYVPVRRYPPRTNELDDAEDEEAGRRFVLMPREIGKGSWLEFLRSPTKEAELRRARRRL